MGKGSKRRPELSKGAWASNWDRIFGKRDTSRLEDHPGDMYGKPDQPIVRGRVSVTRSLDDAEGMAIAAKLRRDIAKLKEQA